jgi:hypothetical protein
VTIYTPPPPPRPSHVFSVHSHFVSSFESAHIHTLTHCGCIIGNSQRRTARALSLQSVSVMWQIVDEPDSTAPSY